jgi:hypothetical protein
VLTTRHRADRVQGSRQKIVTFRSRQEQPQTTNSRRLLSLIQPDQPRLFLLSVLKHPTCAPLVPYHTCERGHVVFTGVFASCSALSVRPALGTKLTGNPRGPGCQRRRQRLAPPPPLSLSVFSSLPVSLPHLYSCSPRMYVSVDPCLSSHTARRVRRQAC